MTAEAMTYDSLVEDVITYSERDDASFVAQIPRLIMLTESPVTDNLFTTEITTMITGLLLQFQTALTRFKSFITAAFSRLMLKIKKIF